MPLNINGTTGISGVDGSVSAPAVTGTDSNTGITFPSADVIKFSTAGVERMAITNSGVTGITAGITMADQWRLSTNFTQGNNVREVIDQNWERADTDSYGAIGSPMTESSGIFTFPETGIYLIFFQSAATNTGSAAVFNSYIDVTTDNSSYSDASISINRVVAASTFVNPTILFIFDVTDTSTHKVKFSVYSSGNNGVIYGNTGRTQTGATFLKIGDT